MPFYHILFHLSNVLRSVSLFSDEHDKFSDEHDKFFVLLRGIKILPFGIRRDTRERRNGRARPVLFLSRKGIFFLFSDILPV